MGHTMVADERNQSLIIYGGFSFHHRILGDVLIYEINKKHMNRVQYNGEGPASRYLHAAAIYKVGLKICRFFFLCTVHLLQN